MRGFPYGGVILDFDGTVIDTRNSRLPLLATVAAEIGCVYYKDREDTAWGLPFAQMLSVLVPECDHHELVVRYQQRMAETTPVVLAGVQEFLVCLSSTHVPVCIFTSSSADLVQLDLELLGIDRLVRAIFGSAEDQPSKPDPAAATVVVDWFARLGVNADGLLYVGDSIDDLLIANAYAIDFVAVLTGSYDRSAFAERGHQRCYATLEEYIQTELT